MGNCTSDTGGAAARHGVVVRIESEDPAVEDRELRLESIPLDIPSLQFRQKIAAAAYDGAVAYAGRPLPEELVLQTEYQGQRADLAGTTPLQDAVDRFGAGVALQLSVCAMVDERRRHVRLCADGGVVKVTVCTVDTGGEFMLTVGRLSSLFMLKTQILEHSADLQGLTASDLTVTFGGVQLEAHASAQELEDGAILLAVVRRESQSAKAWKAPQCAQHAHSTVEEPSLTVTEELQAHQQREQEAEQQLQTALEEVGKDEHDYKESLQQELELQKEAAREQRRQAYSCTDRR